MVPTQSFKDTKDLEKSFDEFFFKFLKFPQALSIPSFTWTIDVQKFHVVLCSNLCHIPSYENSRVRVN